MNRNGLKCWMTNKKDSSRPLKYQTIWWFDTAEMNENKPFNSIMYFLNTNELKHMFHCKQLQYIIHQRPCFLLHECPRILVDLSIPRDSPASGRCLRRSSGAKETPEQRAARRGDLSSQPAGKYDVVRRWWVLGVRITGAVIREPQELI